MVTVLSLWIPILLSAALVFIASSLIHMLLGYHANDYAPLPEEDAIGAAFRTADVPPGEYVIPHARGMKEMSSPEYIEKRDRGPVALLTVRPSGPSGLGAELAAWFAFSVVVSIFAAYVASRAVGTGGEYLDVFRFTATTAFAAYGLGSWSESIWFGRKWSTTIKNTVDGLIYALLTGGVFGWLWPGI